MCGAAERRQAAERVRRGRAATGGLACAARQSGDRRLSMVAMLVGTLVSRGGGGQKLARGTPNFLACPNSRPRLGGDPAQGGRPQTLGGDPKLKGGDPKLAAQGRPARAAAQTRPGPSVSRPPRAPCVLARASLTTRPSVLAAGRRDPHPWRVGACGGRRRGSAGMPCSAPRGEARDAA